MNRGIFDEQWLNENNEDTYTQGFQEPDVDFSDMFRLKPFSIRPLDSILF